MRNKNPYDLVLHSSFKFVGQGKTGKLYNNDTEFKESIVLPHPLSNRREEYKDLRDILPENTHFKIFEKKENEIINAFDFLNVFVPLENFSKSYPKENIITQAYHIKQCKYLNKSWINFITLPSILHLFWSIFFTRVVSNSDRYNST